MVAPQREYHCECPLILKVYGLVFVLSVIGSIAFVVIHNAGPDIDKTTGAPALESGGGGDQSATPPSAGTIRKAVYVVCHCDATSSDTEDRHPHQYGDRQPPPIVLDRCKCGMVELSAGGQYHVAIGDRRLMLVDVSSRQ